MMYPARRGSGVGSDKGCYLKSGGLHPVGGLYNILVICLRFNEAFLLSVLQTILVPV